MSLRTRVFDLAEREGYLTQDQLARAMGLHPATISRTRSGEYGVTAEFIKGALRAFPGKRFEDLFEIVADEQPAESTTAA